MTHLWIDDVIIDASVDYAVRWYVVLEWFMRESWLQESDRGPL